MLPAILIFLALVAITAIWIVSYVTGKLKNSKLDKEFASKGYKYCGSLSTGDYLGASISMDSDGDVFLNHGKKTHPIEINELSRISHGTHLQELEISFSLTDGTHGDRLFTGRIKGYQDELRTYQSRLGWSS